MKNKPTPSMIKTTKAAAAYSTFDLDTDILIIVMFWLGISVFTIVYMTAMFGLVYDLMVQHFTR